MTPVHAIDLLLLALALTAIASTLGQSVKKDSPEGAPVRGQADRN